MLIGGNFYLKSGNAKGYSTDILDNGTNYIQVATTWVNIVNNITSATSEHLSSTQVTNGGFESGLTGWSLEIYDVETGKGTSWFATAYVQSATVYSGGYAFCGGGWSNGYPYPPWFRLTSSTFNITNITKITFWYNIPQYASLDTTYFYVTVEADEGYFYKEYTSTTSGWVQETIDVSSFTGIAYIMFGGRFPRPDW